MTGVGVSPEWCGVVAGCVKLCFGPFFIARLFNRDMNRPNDDQIIESIRMYREALQETQALYVDSGALIRGSYGWLTGDENPDAASIAEQMNDLHQGLLMKIFAAVVPTASARTLEQRQLGRVLLEHIWGKSVMGSQLHEAVDWLIGAAADFQWQDLVRPFAEIPALRDRWGELETLAMRMANLLTSIDGDVSVADNQSLAAMRQQFAALQGRIPEQIDHQADTDNARDALQWLRDEACDGGGKADTDRRSGWVGNSDEAYGEGN
jgi:hypothetical protein